MEVLQGDRVADEPVALRILRQIALRQFNGSPGQWVATL
jgi:hypothetical protein